ncbi:fam-d protein [Plasmodium chabaudi chabaudi]|uniref:Fam-d protein n=1 Tax=Plasmodium chabaudi chabaudi TaxID=31271 RepID=A0A1D3RWA4_PLACU|nr:fam-d protein [Plasmodium chabaudi chabaudi]
MKMMNIILSLFILVVSANVKGASFQSANNSSPKLVIRNPVTQPTVTFTNGKQKYFPYLDTINDVFRDESENIKYAFESGDYRWVITDFDISINNRSPYLKKKFSTTKIEGLLKGTTYFLSYINEKIKCLVTQHMKKYDFENNYDGSSKKLANDLKALIYDQFDNNFKNNLIKYEREPKNEKLKKKAKKFFKALVQNSDMKIKGYFVKIRKDQKGTRLTLNVSRYFNINININKENATHGFELPKSKVGGPVAKPLRKP